MDALTTPSPRSAADEDKKVIADTHGGLLAFEALRGSVDDVIWARGERYFREGRVHLISQDRQKVRGLVDGQETYTVRLMFTAKAPRTLTSVCSCPMGGNGEACKHLVAVAHLWQSLAQDAEAAEDITPKVKRAAAVKVPDTGASTSARGKRRATAAPAEGEDLNAFLRAQSPAALVQCLLGLGQTHPDVQRHLVAWMRSATARNSQGVRQAISTLIGSPGHLDWRASNAFARRIQPLLELVKTTEVNDPGLALDACEHALNRLLAIYARSDDSGGAIHDEIRQLAAEHMRLCEVVRPESKKLAAALLKLHQADEWDFFPIEHYAKSLGAVGMDYYSSRLENLLRALPPRPANTSRRFLDSFSDPNRVERGRLMYLLEAFYTQQGDVDALLKLLANDLHSPYEYLKLIQACKTHQRNKAALDWAERGCKQFKDDLELRAELAALYELDGFQEEALQLHWRNFESKPIPEHYLNLRRAAGSQWPQWRARALNRVGEIEQRTRSSVQLPNSDSDAAEQPPLTEFRVQLHLAEGALDDALEAAEAGAVYTSTLIELVHAAAPSHPLRAAEMLRRYIEIKLPYTTGNYQTLADLIHRYRQLASNADAQQFEAEIRQKYGKRRNLIQLLDARAP